MSYILLVEDNRDHAHLIERTLTAAGYAVRHTELGSEAQQIARSERPDLILLDLDLPDVDGLEILPTLRRGLATQDQAAPPIIAVTGRTPTENPHVVAAWLRKPFAPDALLRLIDNVLTVNAKVGKAL
ncbi:MAG: response regulator transcription factor [Anaerolineae bacterium]|nr:response regulator transcription factor [Anaerolineae bacterium]